MDFASSQTRLADWFERNKSKIAGFAAGIVVPLMLSALVVVSFRGYGMGEDAPRSAPVYTVF